ncbi:hypothetical protein K4H00_26425, partial [Mycobacterium tuberculosis]|nr:hypothetical protein [Mycobacterium tuberculosis]
IRGSLDSDLGLRDNSGADNYRPAYNQPRVKKTRERQQARGLKKFVIMVVILLVAIGLLWLVASGLINSKPSGSTPPSS